MAWDSTASPSWDWDNDVLSQPTNLRKQANAWSDDGQKALTGDTSLPCPTQISPLCTTGMTVSASSFGPAPSASKIAGSSGLSKLSHGQEVFAWGAEERKEGLVTGWQTEAVASRDPLVSLELGKRTYFENSTSGGSKAPPTSLPTNSAPSKKPRASSSSAGQTPRCQVEGCQADLISAKEYHRRHKVCEMHSKASAVIVAGQERRFCQQCSRFQVLSEFDEGKRSCRRRLAGHNERRRKPQTDPLTMSRISSSFQAGGVGQHFMVQSRSFLHNPWTNSVSSSRENSEEFKSMHGKALWLGMKSEDQPAYDLIQGSGMESQSFLSGLSQQTDDRLPFLLLQGPKEYPPMSNDTVGDHGVPCRKGSTELIEHNLTMSSSTGASVLSSYEPRTACLSLSGASDSGRALSLLSSQLQWSYASAPLSLDASTRSSTVPDQWMQGNPLALQFMQGGQQQQFDPTAGKFVTPLSQNISSPTGIPLGMSSLADHNLQLCVNELNGSESFEASSKISGLQDHRLRAPQGSHGEHKISTVDLMHLSAFSQNNLQESSQAFQLEGHPFGELQALQSYDSAMFDSDQ